MFLNIGNLQRIDDPTPQQIGFHLRNLPAEAPFLILDADAEHFIQATLVGDAFRVEWRQEARQRFVLVPVDRAEACFQAFRRWDESALMSFPWKRVTWFDDPLRRWVLAMLAVVVLFVAQALVRWKGGR